MIRKVALSQALREAYPDDLGGLYEPEEINTIEEELPEAPIEAPKPEKKKEQPQEKPQEKVPYEKPEVIDAEVVEPDDEDAVAASLFG